MYSWGGSTRDWKNPGAYKFDSARAPYLDSMAAASKAKGGRHYTTKSAPDKIVDPKGKTITSDSENAIVFGIDVTGSMSTWPREIFDRLPLFYQTLSQYREDLEVSFGAIGDASSDEYPLQVNDFGKGVKLEDHVNALFPEGGGGGQVSESYELFGYFMLEHAKLTKAQSPFLFICGDEKFYTRVDPRQAEHYIGDKLAGPIESQKVLDGLLDKFDVYFLHKPYGHGNDDSITREVGEHWAKAIGRQRVIELPSYDRVVDIAMGIVAKKWGYFGDFKDSLSARHPSSTTRSAVYRSLRFIRDASGVNSVIDRSLPGGKSIPLDRMLGPGDPADAGDKS